MHSGARDQTLATPYRVEKGPGWELRLGRWQDVLADVAECDAVITDPPYSERTHSGQRHGRREQNHAGDGVWLSTRALPYGALDPADMDAICAAFRPVWLCVHTDSEDAHRWRSAMDAVGRTTFSPLGCVLPGMNVRLAGDGPSSWCVWLVVSRRRDVRGWGTLPGAYVVSPGAGWERAKLPVPGAKPVPLMRAIVRDYSRPGDLVVDPYAGGGTTLLAAAMEGRRAIGAEVDPDTFEKAVARLRRGIQTDLFNQGAADAAGGHE